jgi:hypothetical protein
VGAFVAAGAELGADVTAGKTVAVPPPPLEQAAALNISITGNMRKRFRITSAKILFLKIETSQFCISQAPSGGPRSPRQCDAHP